MSAEEAEVFETDPDFNTILLMRTFDEVSTCKNMPLLTAHDTLGQVVYYDWHGYHVCDVMRLVLPADR